MALREPPTTDRQFDLFVPYLSDLPLRDQQDTMERPFFSLSKRKRLKPIDYHSLDSMVWVRIDPHQTYGMATIWDADILIWAASQIADQMEQDRRNEPPSQTLRFHPYNLLKAIRRKTGGDQYARLRDALDRLTFTAIKTNIRADGRKKDKAFSWLDEWTDDVDEKTGESRGMTLTLSKWLYDGIIDQGRILSIHPDYFLLTGALERWLYRVARKHAGMQRHGWSCSLQTLYEKSGSEDEFRFFKRRLKQVVEADNLPEYHLEWRDKTEGAEGAVYTVRRSLLAADHAAFQFPSRKDKRRSILTES